MRIVGIVTAADGVNLRATPNGHIIKALPSGTELRVLERANKVEGSKYSWLRVKAGKDEGWVASAWVSSHAVPDPDYRPFIYGGIIVLILIVALFAL